MLGADTQTKLEHLPIAVCYRFPESIAYAVSMLRRKKEEKALLNDKDRVSRAQAMYFSERTRRRSLSRAFGWLKLTFPWEPSDTRLSKLDTSLGHFLHLTPEANPARPLLTVGRRPG